MRRAAVWAGGLALAAGAFFAVTYVMVCAFCEEVE